jgi:hypothetical protein
MRDITGKPGICAVHRYLYNPEWYVMVFDLPTIWPYQLLKTYAALFLIPDQL